MKHIKLILSVAFAFAGFIVSFIIDPNGYLPFSVTLVEMGMFAVLGFAIGMIIDQKIEKEKEASNKVKYEKEIKLAEFYLRCLKSGYSSFDSGNEVALEKIRLFSQNLSYYHRGDDKSIQNAFEEAKKTANKLGKEIYLHVQQNASTKNPDKWAIRNAKRPIDRDINEDTLLALYKLGEKCVNTVDVIRKEEEEERRKLDAFIHLTGRSKRIAMLNKRAHELAQEVSSFSLLSDNWGQKKESDWAIAGGIASAIGGAGAGVAAAVNTQIKNAGIRAQNAQMAQTVNALNNQMFLRHTQKQEDLKSLQAEIEETRAKLVESEEDNARLMSRLTIKCENISLTETGAARITAKITLNSDKELYIRQGQVRATIDGVIRANLIEGGVRIGTAYLTLPLYGIDYSRYATEVKGMCTTVRNPSAHYQIEFEAHHLWMMER